MAPSIGKNIIIKIHSYLLLLLNLFTNSSTLATIQNAITANNIRRKSSKRFNTPIIKINNGNYFTKHIIIDMLICNKL